MRQYINKFIPLLSRSNLCI